MFQLEKLVPKLPGFAFPYWDRFLGICLVLVGLIAFLQRIPHAIGLLLSGFGVITLSVVRECWHYIGAVRLQTFQPKYKRTLVYPRVLAIMFWLPVSWGFFRYAALDFQITAQWLRWILHY